MTALAGVDREDEGDTIEAIDRLAEHVLIEEIARTLAPPLDVTTDAALAGCAHGARRASIEPHRHAALARRGVAE